MKYLKFTLFAVLIGMFTSVMAQKNALTTDQISKQFPQELGNLHVERNYIVFREIYNNDSQTDTMKIYNDMDKPMTFEAKDIPNYIKVVVIPATLEAKSVGKLLVTYDAKVRATYGYDFYRLGINTNDDKQLVKLFNVSANIVENFSALTPEEVENAPVIEFQSESYNYGNVVEGDIVKYSYVFTNKGKRDLVIRNCKASCGCTASNPAKSILKPGESSSIDVQFNSANRRGQQSKTITVISNDPKNFQKVLVLQGNVDAIDAVYPKLHGNIRFDKDVFNFGTFKNNEIKSDSLVVYNSSYGQINFENGDTASYISIRPLSLNANQKGWLVMTIDGSKMNSIGKFNRLATIKTTDQNGTDKPFKYEGTVLNDFSKLSEKEKMAAPKISIIMKNVDLGRVKLGEKSSKVVEIQNLGKGTMQILKIVPDCDCIVTQVEKSSLKKNKKTNLTLTLTPLAGNKEMNQMIYIYTNDPENQETIVNVHAIIE